MRKSSIAVILSVFIVGCGGKNSDSPTGPTGVAASGPTLGSCTQNSGCPLSSTIGIFFQFMSNPADQAFSFTFAGQSFTGSGAKNFEFVGLSSGDYEVSGQMQPQRLTILVSRHGAYVDGGVRPGSVQSLEGPLANLRACGVEYGISGNATSPQNFKFKFTVDPSLNRTGGQDVAC